MRHVVERYKPHVVCEMNAPCLRDGGRTPEDLLAKLHGFGYDVQAIREPRGFFRGASPRSSTSRTRADLPWPVGDLLCTPRGDSREAAEDPAAELGSTRHRTIRVGPILSHADKRGNRVVEHGRVLRDGPKELIDETMRMDRRRAACEVATNRHALDFGCGAGTADAGPRRTTSTA